MIGALWWAELRKLLSRPLGRVGLLLVAGVGVLGPLLLWLAANAGVSMNGEDLSTSMDLSATNGIRFSLFLRKAFLVQVVLAVLAALSYAGELQSHTLREDLVRPVPRPLVLLAKWGALSTWSALAIVVQLVVAAGLGLLLHAREGDTPWNLVLLGFATQWLAEVAFAAVALAAAVVLRSVAASVLVVFLGLVFEFGLSLLIALIEQFVNAVDPETPLGPLRAIVETAPFLPTTAWWAPWNLLQGSDPVWQPWAATLAYAVVAAIVAERWFDRTDVP